MLLPFFLTILARAEDAQTSNYAEPILRRSRTGCAGRHVRYRGCIRQRLDSFRFRASESLVGFPLVCHRHLPSSSGTNVAAVCGRV